MLINLKSLSVIAALAVFVGLEAQAEQTRVLTDELRAERANAPSGSLTMEQRKYSFPMGCDYVAHELAVIEEIPRRAPDDYRGIFDVLDKSRTAKGAERIDSLRVRISAFRHSSLPPGPLLMVVKLTLTVSCTDEDALKQLLRSTDLHVVESSPSA